MIWSLLILILTLTVDLITDVRLFYKKKTVNHFRGAGLRLIGIIPACVLYWPVVFLLPDYWAFFDMIYAKSIGQPLTYVGTTGRLDRLQRKYLWLIVLKYVLAVAGIVTFIII